MAASHELKGGDLVKRHRLSTRLWHWLNAFTIFTMVASGLMIFNAHPRLYWGAYGANLETPWLEISNDGTHGFVSLLGTHIPTTGVLGLSHYADGSANPHAFPGWATLPEHYDLAKARRWHLFFAWLLVVPGILYLLRSLMNRHIQGDLLPTRAELSPKHIWHDIKEHARLRFPTGAAALHHNILQKISYLGVLFVLLPGIILSGLTLSPGMTATWPWLLWLMGGRASARSVHFICMSLIVAFIVVHLIMVVLAGPYNEIRSMITGKFRLPLEKSPPLMPAEEAAQ
jgi:thiosulfate reductase cytochrome b subunit